MKKLIIFFYLLAASLNLFAQSLAINTDGSSANSTAMLDIKSTTKGFLPPRMSQVQRDAIITPATGLIVQCTDCSTIGPYTYNGTQWVSMSYKTFKIGDAAFGGIVIWVDESGQHGLVAATVDQSISTQWWTGTYVHLNKVRTDGIGTGLNNSEVIITALGNATNYAAKYCANYLGGGYGDWYLPSKYELNLVYLQKPLLGVFASGAYWSSTESNANQAWVQSFDDGSQSPGYDKGGFWAVRAVRKF
jgi:hypothetical protein